MNTSFENEVTKNPVLNLERDLYILVIAKQILICCGNLF